MPEFTLDTSGEVQCDERTRFETTKWRDLDAFTQGYIEALFFTSGDGPGVFEARTKGADAKSHPLEVGFSDLAPEALALILADCDRFQQSIGDIPVGDTCPDEAQAGRDFWYTRNGHGCGFWDGDWPEPFATQLTDASEAFGEVNPYLGDDGKVYL